MAIDYKYGVGLTVILNSVILVFKFYEKILQKKARKYFHSRLKKEIKTTL